MIRLCRCAGLPEPAFQYELAVDGLPRRLDFAFPALRLAIEVDGYERHSRFGVFEDDRKRANGLELAGWVLLRFTWTQVTQQPDYVIRVLTAALGATRPRERRPPSPSPHPSARNPCTSPLEPVQRCTDFGDGPGGRGQAEGSGMTRASWATVR